MRSPELSGVLADQRVVLAAELAKAHTWFAGHLEHGARHTAP